MDLAELLAQERRARLAAERLLAQKQAELSVANRALSRHARALSVEVIEQREEITGVRTDLEAAETKVSVAERRLWTALRSLRDGFALFDADDRLVAANPAWLAPFDGVAAVAPGAAYADILRIAAEEGVVDIGIGPAEDWVRRMLDRWTAAVIEPQVIRLWNGGWIRLVDRRGEGGDMVSMALNVTGAIRRERHLREARGRAEAANRAKSAFLANMSHELRTPMNGVVAISELLGETRLDGEQRGLVQTIRQSGESLLTIINDILDLSKIDADRLTLTPAPFDLEASVLDVIALMRPLAGGAAAGGQPAGALRPAGGDGGFRLIADVDMDVPQLLVGDANRVRQILTNLVGNAVKFTPSGHVAVRVRMQEGPVAATGDAAADPSGPALPAASPPQWIEMAVEDTGIGIPADLVRHVFGEFNQAEETRSRRFEGTGLGLAITERLVRMMQGEIRVQSVEGQGSVFSVRLPLAASGPSPAPLPPDLCGRPVAIVLPDPLVRDVLARQVAALGAVPLTLAPAEAVAALSSPGGSARGAILVLAAADPPAAAAGAPPGPAAWLATGLTEAGSEVPVLALSSHPETGAPPGDPAAAVLGWPLSRESLRQALIDHAAPAADPASLPAATLLPDPGPAGPDPIPAPPPAAGAEPPTPPLLPPPASEADAAAHEAGPARPRADPPTDPAGPGAAHGATPAANLRRPMRVLAAEDNLTNRLVLSRMLGGLDISLRFAANGAEAVAIHADWAPDLIFMDISMPLMDGKEATRLIRAAEAGSSAPPVPIVALTAHALSGDAEDILAAGLDHYMTKPLRKARLLDRLHAAWRPDLLPPLPVATAPLPETSPCGGPVVLRPAIQDAGASPAMTARSVPMEMPEPRPAPVGEDAATSYPVTPCPIIDPETARPAPPSFVALPPGGEGRRAAGHQAVRVMGGEMEASARMQHDPAAGEAGPPPRDLPQQNSMTPAE